MKIFIDTANIEQIKEAKAWGLLDGVTTNPTLMAKENIPAEKLLKEICSLVDGPISAEVISQDQCPMVEEAKKLAAIHRNIVIKIPLTKDGLKATKILRGQDIRVNVTLCFSATQALLAAKAGASFISPFIGRLDDISHCGMDLIRDIKKIYDNYQFKTQIIVASIRNPLHVLEAALIGADIATVPFVILEQLFKHPLTDIGIKRFLDDYKKAPQNNQEKMHQAKIPACRQAEKFKIQRYLKVFNFGLSFWFFIFSATLLGGPAKIFGGGILACAFAQEGTKEPVIVDGDKVEFFSEEKKVTAEGNVIVSQKKAKLVCDKVTVYTETQDAIAEGHVRFYYEKGVLFAEKFIYNFQSKKGKLIDADIESPPYYGKGQFAEKVSEYELKIKHGYFTTCDEKNPHYKLRSKKLNIFPGDKVVAKEVLFQVGKFPLMYLPSYTHPIDDRRPRVTVLPGRTKDWGYFLLSAWRYYFTENAMGRFHVDYREKKDVAWGFDHKYKIENMGEGLFKTYYMNERSISAKHVYEIYDEERNTVEKERFRIQLRHKWEINPQETAILEYNKIKDATFLKDYFLREYEEDGQPSSYFLYTRSLPEYTFSFYTKKRTNRIFAEVERLPEMKIETPDLNITRLFLEDNSPTSDKGLQFELQKTNAYFKNSTSFSNLVSKGVVPDSEVSDQAKRFDTYNQLSLQRKFVFIETRPHAGFRETFYSKDRYNDENLFRGIFDSGIDLSTKFYRIFDVTSDFMDIEINKLRHIITPTASYSYVHPPTIPSSKLNYFDSLDSIGQTNKMSLALSNKFQTKRENNTIDFVNFTVSSDYSFKPKGDRGSSFSDFLFDLETIPYEWLRIEADATYDHFEDYFKTVNSDLTANITDKTSASFGYRYQRKSTRDYITNFNYRINPKWWFSVYERFEQLGRGLTEQEYTIERDLHCWTMAFTYSVKRGRGEEIWLVFSIKAFPEMGFEFNKSYRAPKRGTQFGGP